MIDLGYPFRKGGTTMSCSTSANKNTCPCTADCKNHGHCCECIKLHRQENIHEAVACMQCKFAEKK